MTTYKDIRKEYESKLRDPQPICTVQAETKRAKADPKSNDVSEVETS